MNERIKDRLRELQITNKEFAKRLNVSEAHLSMILSGKRGVSVKLLIDIANKLNVTTDWLIFGKENVK